MPNSINVTDFLKKATHTAAHFGFSNLEETKKLLPPERQSKLEHSISAQDRKVDSLFGILANGAVQFADNRLHNLPGPVLFYSVEQVPRSNEAALSLQVYGVEKSIAEAILIQTMRSLAGELGFADTSVRINSLGDKESINRYNRELANYLKKRLDDIPPQARELMKENAFSALLHLIEKEHELGYKAPSPMEYLSDQSRKHFREVVEFLDMSDTPYEIDPKLLGNHECFSESHFSIDTFDTEGKRDIDAPLLMRGGRYGAFTDKYLKRPVHATGGVVILKDSKSPEKVPKNIPPKHPLVHVIQLGFGPKIKSLLLIDELRQSGIIVKQNLASDSLSAQLRAAEDAGAAYTIIIGQKEFVDGTVILRDMIGRNQEYVSGPQVISRLKKALRV